MNKSISFKEFNKREKQFLKDYLKWNKSNKNKPAPIFPPELQQNEIGDSNWEYRKGEELILGGTNKKRDKIIKKIVSAYKKRKLERIKDGELWKNFE
jgi:hypothetical protein